MGRPTVLIGWVARPHGVRGDVRVKASGPTLGRLRAGASIILRDRRGEETEHRVAAVSGEGDRLILRLDSVSDRGRAGELTQHEILVAEDVVPAIEDVDTFYVRDLVGFVVEVDGEALGEIADVVPGPANDSLDVRGGGETVLIPFTGDAVVAIDPDRRIVEVRGGLLAP
ncbi:MAG: ribosome maturation factor RimM [Miltoncostaeaceae bacterium]